LRTTPNISYAVRAQRHEPPDSLDDFPTPPWATRALCEYVIKDCLPFAGTCLEPACGRGYMAEALKDYFGKVRASDVFDYGYGKQYDFAERTMQHDWVITNPPFRLAEDLVLHSFDLAIQGVAILARTSFLESVHRYNAIYNNQPPAIVAQFVERVPMFKGRLDPHGSTATSYAWFVWLAPFMQRDTKFIWIPPCRRALEEPDDYTERSDQPKERLPILPRHGQEKRHRTRLVRGVSGLV
jgi:hypothetical protein